MQLDKKLRRPAIAGLSVVLLALAACSAESKQPAVTDAGISTPVIASGCQPYGDFGFIEPHGTEQRLSDICGSAPLAVVFFGNVDCHECLTHLAELQRSYGLFQSLGARLVAVGTDSPDRVETMAGLIGLEFPVVADPDGVISRNWQGFSLPFDTRATTGTFVFGPAGELIAVKKSLESAGGLISAGELLQTINDSLRSGVA